MTQWPCKHQAAVISGKCLKKGLAFWKIYPQCKLSYLCISSLRGALFSSPSFDLIKGHYPEEEKTHNVQSFKLLAPVHQPLLWNICSCIYFVFSLFFFPLLDLRGSHIVQVKAQTEETPGQGLCNFPTKKKALKSANFVQFQRSCLIQHWAWFWQLCEKRWEKSWGVTVGDLFKGFFCLLNIWFKKVRFFLQKMWEKNLNIFFRNCERKVVRFLSFFYLSVIFLDLSVIFFFFWNLNLFMEG